MTVQRARNAEVIMSLRALTLSVERGREQFARRHGLAINDSAVLSRLAAADGRRLQPRDLALRMDVRTGTLTSMLDRLEALDFVRRVPNPDDRRSTFVELTDRGATALNESLKVFEELLAAEIPSSQEAAFAHHVSVLSSILTEVTEVMARQ